MPVSYDLEEVYWSALKRNIRIRSYEYDVNFSYRVEIEENDGKVFTVTLVSNDIAQRTPRLFDKTYWGV